MDRVENLTRRIENMRAAMRYLDKDGKRKARERITEMVKEMEREIRQRA